MNETPDYMKQMKPDYLKKISQDSKRTADAVEKLVFAVRFTTWLVGGLAIIVLLTMMDNAA